MSSATLAVEAGKTRLNASGVEGIVVISKDSMLSVDPSSLSAVSSNITLKSTQIPKERKGNQAYLYAN